MSASPQTRLARAERRIAFAVFAAALLLVPSALAAKYKVLHSFAGGADGGGLLGPVILDVQGNLYGTTWGSGAYGYGTVFELSPGTGAKWTNAILHSFCAQPHCTDGALPSAGLALDPAGNLYGVAGGGVQNSGVTFELSPAPTSPSGWNFQVIYDVSSGSSLILDQLGNLYGPLGPGQYGKGAVTELSPGADGWTESYLYSFCPVTHCLDGDVPHSALTWDASGNLYGTTDGGGKDNLGVVFELENTAKGWKEHVLHNFPSFPHDGNPPSPGGVVLDAEGNVYGTTDFGGKGCEGTGCGPCSN